MRSKIEKAGLRFEVLVPCLVGGVHPLRVSLGPDGSLLSISSRCTEQRPSEAAVAVCRSLQGDALRYEDTCESFVTKLTEAIAGVTGGRSVDFPRHDAYPQDFSHSVYTISERTFGQVVQCASRLSKRVRRERTSNVYNGGLGDMEMYRRVSGLYAVAKNRVEMEAYLEHDRMKGEYPPSTFGSITNGDKANTGFFRPVLTRDEEGKMQAVMVASYNPKYGETRFNELRPFGTEQVVAVRTKAFSWRVEEQELYRYAIDSITRGDHSVYNRHCVTCDKSLQDLDSHVTRGRHQKVVRQRLMQAMAATDDYYQRGMLRKMTRPAG
jgi:hypothetical protein